MLLIFVLHTKSSHCVVQIFFTGFRLKVRSFEHVAIYRFLKTPRIITKLGFVFNWIVLLCYELYHKITGTLQGYIKFLDALSFPFSMKHFKAQQNFIVLVRYSGLLYTSYIVILSYYWFLQGYTKNLNPLLYTIFWKYSESEQNLAAYFKVGRISFYTKNNYNIVQ